MLKALQPKSNTDNGKAWYMNISMEYLRPYIETLFSFWFKDKKYKKRQIDNGKVNK